MKAILLFETTSIKKGTILVINIYLENNQRLSKKIILN